MIQLYNYTVYILQFIVYVTHMFTVYIQLTVYCLQLILFKGSHLELYMGVWAYISRPLYEFHFQLVGPIFSNRKKNPRQIPSTGSLKKHENWKTT